MANELIKTNSNVIEAADNYNPNFGNIRNIIVDEEVWLCGLDVCDVLGYADAPKILKYHVKEAERKKFPISSHGQNRKMVFINSRGFYDLCQGSKLPHASDIKDWIKSKFFIAVENNKLPAVTMDALVNNPDFVNKVSNQVADRIIEKAANYDALKGSKSLIPMKDVADTLAIPGIGRNNLFKILRERNILNDENKPYREYIENGWFRSVESEYTTKGGVHISFTTKATVKGLENIRRLLKEWGVLIMVYKITYSVNEVMEILGLCRRSIIRYIKAKKLDAFKVGSQWRIFGESLKTLIEGGTPHGD